VTTVEIKYRTNSIFVSGLPNITEFPEITQKKINIIYSYYRYTIFPVIEYRFYRTVINYIE